MNQLTDNGTSYNNIIAPKGGQKRRREAISEANTNIPAENDRAPKKRRANRLYQQGDNKDRPTLGSYSPAIAPKLKHVLDFDIKRALHLPGLYMPKEYVETIMEGMHKDAPTVSEPDYFELVQEDIRPSMRTLLCGWLTEVVTKFEMQETVLWLTFQLLDRYLAITSIKRENFQLLGCAALWVASKYHETYPPISVDLVHMSAGAFKKEQLVEMEADLCDKLGYEFTRKTSFEYLERFTDIAVNEISPTAHKDLEAHLETNPASSDVTPAVKKAKRTKFLARYAMERYNLCAESVGRPPKHVAAMALYTALSLTSNNWSPLLAKTTGFTHEQLLDPNFPGGSFTKFKHVVLNFEQEAHNAVIMKYKIPQLGQVSTLRKK